MTEQFLTEEHTMFREDSEIFLKKEVVPFIDKWEKDGTIERFYLEEVWDMGYFGSTTQNNMAVLD